MTQSVRLSYESGTLSLAGGDEELLRSLPGVSFDGRSSSFRAEAGFYRGIVEHLVRIKHPFEDAAKSYDKVTWTLKSERDPFPHQLEAVETWAQRGMRGVVVLPTGTGKTFTAMLAIRRCGRPALVVTPTIDLLNQWHWDLSQTFSTDVGMMGGGEYRLTPLTVTTYDSAYIHLERWGNRYGLIVFDECHHLPGPSYQIISRGSLTPFRLGLTATPERADGGEMLYQDLIGPTVYRREIKELSGDFLAEYTTLKLFVSLSEEEQTAYQYHRDIYKRFIQAKNISMGGANGWQRFIFEASRSKEGWEAFRAYREQKRLERAAGAKLRKLEELLIHHANDRIIIFTADNATVYQIARDYLVPPITHQTKSKERKQILERFHSGEYMAVVTSQVLNEGVDVPAANVGIVLSGTATVRESVQRLGRLLRKAKDKQAILYEIIARGTTEEFASERRRQHGAFQ